MRLCRLFSDRNTLYILRKLRYWIVSMTSLPILNHLEILKIRLKMLLRRHRDLDDAIHALDQSRRADQLTLRRLKKQKLALKDDIARIENELTPNIIA